MFRIDHLQPRLYMPVFLNDMRTNGYHGRHRGIDWYEAFIELPKLKYQPRFFLASMAATKGVFYQPELDTTEYIRRLVTLKPYIDPIDGKSPRLGISSVTCESRTGDEIAFLLAEMSLDPRISLEEWCEMQKEAFMVEHPHLRT